MILFARGRAKLDQVVPIHSTPDEEYDREDDDDERKRNGQDDPRHVSRRAATCLGPVQAGLVLIGHVAPLCNGRA